MDADVVAFHGEHRLQEVRMNVGLDIGSISVNAVVMDSDGRILEDHYLYCRGKPYEVLKRRMVGKKMKKADDSLADIQEHADIDRAAAVSIAIGVGAPVKIIKNDDTEKTASFIIGLLDED